MAAATAASGKLPPRHYVVAQRVLVRRPDDKAPFEAVVKSARDAAGLWGVEGAAPLGALRVPDAQVAPSVRREEEVVYLRKDGVDVAATVVSVDLAIWPPSYALKETASGAMCDTNPGRFWPPAARRELLAEAAADALMEEEAEEAGKAGGGKAGGGKGGGGKGGGGGGGKKGGKGGKA